MTMQQLMTMNVLTMSSVEIANLVGSRHDKVKQSIERLADRSIITQPPMGVESYRDGSGRTVIMEIYSICKRDSFVVVAQLCPEFTARLVDRWQELEANKLPQTFEQALRLAADQQAEISHQAEQLAIAAPKAAVADLIAATSEDVGIRDMSGLLCVPEGDVKQRLLDLGWCHLEQGYRGRTVPNRPTVVAGLMRTGEEYINGAYRPRTFFTAKGVVEFSKEYANARKDD